jgi:hypothetical protein
MQSDQSDSTEVDEDMPDIQPIVIRNLAKAAEDIQFAARSTRWGYVSDHCANALMEIKKAIVHACGRIE